MNVCMATLIDDLPNLAGVGGNNIPAKETKAVAPRAQVTTDGSLRAFFLSETHQQFLWNLIVSKYPPTTQSEMDMFAARFEELLAAEDARMGRSNVPFSWIALEAIDATILQAWEFDSTAAVTAPTVPPTLFRH